MSEKSLHEITITKGFTAMGNGRVIGTYESSAGVTVQNYQDGIVTTQVELNYPEYADFRQKFADKFGVMLPDWQPPDPGPMPLTGGYSGTGNTVGRIVGETAPAEVSAAGSNPPVETETEEESDTGSKVLDGIQVGLDVIGLVPGVGEIVDGVNGLISLARGDYAGAVLSFAAMIPFAGWGATAGKVAKRGGNVLASAKGAGKGTGKDAGEKAGKEASEKAGKDSAEQTGKSTDGKGSNDGGGVKERKKDVGPCDHLRQGSGKGPYRGGAHSKTKGPTGDGMDSHHMPADAVSPLRKDDGPAIQMETGDHRKTSSWGSGTASTDYRRIIQGLWREGRWRDVMVEEIKDVRRVQNRIGEPGKYNEAMLEMLEYFKCLEKYKLLPKH